MWGARVGGEWLEVLGCGGGKGQWWGVVSGTERGKEELNGKR